MARSTELATAAVQAVLALRGRRPTCTGDPILDEVALLIQEGLRCGAGFVSDLVHQAMAAGLVLDASMLTEMLIAGARVAGKAVYKSSEK